ncbi:MAG: OB-fold domain-containing protein [Actinobacteria bacterium]|nr:OB-fold domain-containing protein [Actinomycetota bacterium]
MSDLAPSLEVPYREALAVGALAYQRCACGHAWLPPRSHCPRCLGTEIGWRRAEGGATLVSWVVYHRAFDPALEPWLPYNVALVELDEGPRLITNVVAIGEAVELHAGLRLRLRVEREGEANLARFTPDA